MENLLNAGTLTVAGVMITTSESTVETFENTVTVQFELNRSISTPRAVAVNGNNIGHLQNAGEKVSVTLTATDGMTVNIVFSAYS